MTQSSNPSFTAKLWESIIPTYEAIQEHPFMNGLTSGDLDHKTFVYYIIQDTLYIRDYARALALLAVKAPQDDTIMLFSEHARACIEIERGLHESIFEEVGITEEMVEATSMAPTCRAYTSYLLAVAYGRPYAEALAAVLPCYWIYWEVGKVLAKMGSAEPLYQRWIDAYGAESFGETVQAVLDLTNETATKETEETRSAMIRHFVTTSRYEWMFWDMGYRQEKWPV